MEVVVEHCFLVTASTLSIVKECLSLYGNVSGTASMFEDIKQCQCHASRLFSYDSGCSVITLWPNRLRQLISDGIHSSAPVPAKRKNLRSNFSLKSVQY